MRSMLVLTLAGTAALLGGCQYAGYNPNSRYASSIYTEDIPPRKVYFPIVMKFPDDTMYFYPASDDPPRSDLKLNSMRCVAGTDGFVVVAANVKNLGSNIVAPIPLLSGDVGAFRVGATVTTVSGAREQVYATDFVPLTVGGVVTLVLSPIRAPAGEIVRIDVEADPDRVVPDPLRDNNVLSWRGTMQAANPQCVVAR